MDTISITTQDEIAILNLDHGIPNTITPLMVTEFNTALDEIQKDEQLRGLVVSSTNEKFFSIGFDIPNLFPLPRQEFEAFFAAFNQLSIKLYSFPKATIAAMRGHAIAGGCILALCCDYRTMAAGRTLMGLNEIKLGAPVPYPVDCILRDLIGSRKARQVMEFGEFFGPEVSLQFGMVDQISPPEKVLTASIEKLSQITKNPSKAYTIIKQNRVQPVEAQILSRLEQVRADFADCWYSEETRELLKAAIEKF
jgi:enoyl-CoA hydratase/carnithine racemase